MKCSFFSAAMILGAVLGCLASAQAGDWVQFRGPDGAGISADKNVPVTWSDTENLLWKTALPGPGSSSPIVLGDKVFVTSYSGYGESNDRGGSVQGLKRELVCVNRKDGKVLWTTTVAAEQPEDGYQGFISEHGYASNTPVTDGERIYCFFGKSGVLAFDLNGKQLWKTDVGKESSNRRWGSGSSLILYKDSVIVNASEESRSIRALDKKTGKEVWKAAGSALELAYSTPALAKLPDGRTDLVVSAPSELWGLNPDTGKLRWYCENDLGGTVSPSPVVDGTTIYAFGGNRPSGSIRIQAGGEGDAKSKVEWTSRSSTYVATPVLYEDHLYWIDDRGQAYCISAKTGEEVYRQRVEGLSSGGRPVYASPVLVDGKLYIPTRWSGVLVVAAKPKWEVLAQNKFTGDETDFNATPAVSDGQLFLRSDKFLYCVSKK